MISAKRFWKPQIVLSLTEWKSLCRFPSDAGITLKLNQSGIAFEDRITLAQCGVLSCVELPSFPGGSNRLALGG